MTPAARLPIQLSLAESVCIPIGKPKISFITIADRSDDLRIYRKMQNCVLITLVKSTDFSACSGVLYQLPSI